MKLIKKEYILYNGDRPMTLMTGFCTKCQANHTLPNKEWVLISGRKRKKIKLACMESVKDEIAPKK